MTADAAVDAVADAMVDAPVDAPPAPTIAWTACGGRFECGTLTVPLSYDDPALGSLDLVAMRWPAEDPASRIGTLFIAPGGPGQPGTSVLRNLVTAMNPGMGEVLRRFDLVTLDLRGTGGSGPIVTCVSDMVRSEIASMLVEAPDDATVDSLVDQGTAGCLTSVSRATLSRLDTASTAHDIDRLRVALGEPTISMFGVSYGTWVSAVYGALFPSKLRAAVLGSVVSGDGLDVPEATLRGSQIAIEGFTDWCDATATCAFRPTDGTTTMAALLALATSVRATPLTGGGRTLHSAQLGATLRAMLYAPSYPAIASVLASARNGDPLPAFANLDAFYASTANMWKDSHTVILQLDHPLDQATALASWRARLPAMQTDAPLFTLLDGGDRQLDVRIGVRWPYLADHPVTTVASPTAPPYLLVGGMRDPVTPISNATALAATLGNGSHVLPNNALGHSGVPAPCSQRRASAYMLDPSAAVDTTMCADRRVSTDETLAGVATAAFVWDGQSSRRMETSLGDFITDAMRAASTSVDVALVNGGGIRAGLPASSVHPVDTTLRRPEAGYAAGPPYDLIAEDAHAVLPFDNRIATLTVTGQDLWKLLEFCVSQWSATTGSTPFMQISGVHFTFSGSAAVGSRVTAVTRADGTPIANDTSTTYKLAVPDFVYYGGTGYYGLVGYPAQIGVSIDSALATALQAGSPVTFATDGRITIAP